MMRTLFRFVLCALAALSALPSQAQNFPVKAIRVVSGGAPGGSQDIAYRVIAGGMSKALGQPIVVEPMVGAASLLAARYVAKQVAPDGYTLLGLTNFSVHRVLVKDPGYQLGKDLVPVSLFAEQPLYLITNDEVPFKTFNEMIAYAKANPERVHVAIAPAPDLHTVNIAMISQRYDVRLTTVGYKAGQPAYHLALLRNEVQLAAAALESLKRNAKFRALAITGEQRNPAYPQVPTYSELDLAGIESFALALFAPSATPKAVVDRLYGAVASAKQMKDVQDQGAKLELSVIGLDPEASARRFSEHEARIAEAARKAGIEAQ